MRRKLWIALGVVLVLALAAGMILQALQPARESTPHPRCWTNLHQIGYALQVYSNDNNDESPPNLGSLFPRFVEGGHTFRCPHADRGTLTVTVADLPPGAVDASSVFADRHTDYRYIPGLTSTYNGACIVVHGRKGDHPPGRWVLTVCSSVQWMTEEEFQAALAKTREYLKARSDVRPATPSPPP